ncbi:MAG: helix-turn-helix domain-containing protein [Neomegalonema sp.]|nr:helix-turn-helix domain-containing protein [Neomegalonema sp.]
MKALKSEPSSPHIDDNDPSDMEALTELTHGLLVATAEAKRRRGGAGGLALPVGFGRRLQELRKRLRLTRSQFSALYGLPEETVKTWETKRRSEPAPSIAAELMLRVIDSDPRGASDMVWSVTEIRCPSPATGEKADA